MNLKNLRLLKGLTQEQVADMLDITRRTYIKYEQNEEKISKSKLQYIYQVLENYGRIDEEHGILTISEIIETCNGIFKEYDVNFAYLFGSYAKGIANETSDIDIVISMEINEYNFFEIIEDLRERLKKKIDLLDVSQLINNAVLINEILKDGIKIYG